MAITAMSFTAFAAADDTTVTVTVKDLSSGDPIDSLTKDNFTMTPAPDSVDLTGKDTGVYVLKFDSGNLVVGTEYTITTTGVSGYDNNATGVSFTTGAETIAGNYPVDLKLTATTTTPPTGDKTDYTYAFGYELAGGATMMTTASLDKPVILWLNGGKTTFTNGASYDGKSKQVNLYQIETTGSKVEYYNISAAKDIVWVSSSVTVDATADFDKGKYKVPAAQADRIAKEKNIPKVSKGKVSVGKEAGDTFVTAFRVTGKGADAVATELASFKVTTKVAPAKMGIYTDKDTNLYSDPKPKATTAVTVPVGASSDPLYVIPSIKDATADAAITYNDLTYTLTTSSAEATVTCNGMTGTSITVGKTDLAMGFKVNGVSLKATTKTVKDEEVTTYSAASVNVTVTNVQSSKSAKLKVSVVNTATGVPTDNQTKLVPGLSGSYKAKTQELKWGEIASIADTTKSLTKAPTVKIYSDKGSGKVITAADVDSKGAIVETTENGLKKSDFGSGVLVTAKSSVDQLTLTVKEVKEGKEHDKDYTDYIVIVFDNGKTTVLTVKYTATEETVAVDTTASSIKFGAVAATIDTPATSTVECAATDKQVTVATTASTGVTVTYAIESATSEQAIDTDGLIAKDLVAGDKITVTISNGTASENTVYVITVAIAGA